MAMEIIKLLKQIKWLDYVIKQEQENIENYIILKSNLAGYVSSSKGKTSSPVDIAVLNLEKSQEKLAKYIIETTNLKTKVESWIDTLYPTERIIIKEYYFNGKSLKQISKELNYSCRQVQRHKNKALKTIP